jgi:hypothetical protein
MIAACGPTVASAARGPFLVPTNSAATGFGPFQETQQPATPSDLRRHFGPQSTAHKVPGDYFSSCRLTWNHLGITASFTDYPYGSSVNACTDGYFQRARLTDSRWHTPGGIGPGDSEAAARSQARGPCSRPSCGARHHVVLGFHRSACGPELFTGVVASFKGGTVAALIVRSHLCD